MTATVTLTTLTHSRAIAKVVGVSGGDAASIKLSDLVISGQSGYVAASGYSGQSGWSGNASTVQVTISQVAYSCDSTKPVTISRNGVVLYTLFGSGVLPYGTNDQSTCDIDINFGTSAGGTVILELSKTNGYSAILQD